MSRNARGSIDSQEDVESDSDREVSNNSRLRYESGPYDGLFTIEGEPALFYMYTVGPGGLSLGQVEALSRKIIAEGGDLIEKEEQANVIIAPYVVVDALREKYWDSRTVYVEEPAFIRTCINTRRFRENLHRPIRKGMGGRSRGSERRAFTAEDDLHLCEYLAKVVPNEKEGGRSGIEIYKRLLRSAQHFDDRRWALRHTFWSWRERYRKRHILLDPIIDRLVEESPPREDGKGLYERTRLLNPGVARLLRSDEEDMDEEEFEQFNSEREQQREQIVDPSARRRTYSQREDEDTERTRDADRRSSMHPAKRARHTDLGPQVQVISPVEQRRGARRPTSFPDALLAKQRSTVVLDEDDNLPFEMPSNVSETDHPFEQDSSAEADDNHRPGPEEAGPSGTQRTPTPEPPQMQKGSRHVEQHRRQKAQRPRPVQRGTRNVALGAQVPMSSQATLIGTTASQVRRELAEEEEEEGEGSEDDLYAGPTQIPEVNLSAPPASRQRDPRSLRSRQAASGPAPRSTSNSERAPQQEATAAPSHALNAKTVVPTRKKRAKSKRILVVEPPSEHLFPNAVLAQPPAEPPASISSRVQKGALLGPAGPDAVSSSREQLSNHANQGRQMNSPAIPQDALSEDSNEDADIEEEIREAEDDEVEKLVRISKISTHHDSYVSTASRRSNNSHPFEEELDSDDQRAQASLLPDSVIISDRLYAVGPASRRSTLSSHMTGIPVSIPSDNSDEEMSPSNINQHGRSHHMHVMQNPGSRDGSRGGSAARGRVSATGMISTSTALTAGDLSRRAVNGLMTSDTDSVPMPGTRAREEKIRKEEELRRTPYTPPRGTRAAAATLVLRNRKIVRADGVKARR